MNQHDTKPAILSALSAGSFTRPLGFLEGTDGADRLWGRSGADTIVGLGGTDLIKGVGCDDTIDGGDGSDVL